MGLGSIYPSHSDLSEGNPTFERLAYELGLSAISFQILNWSSRLVAVP